MDESQRNSDLKVVDDNPTAGPEKNEASDVSQLLDNSLRKIGFGRYQWCMFVLCGLGWVSDNMWTSAPSIVLFQVQTEFKVTSTLSGLGASSIAIGQFFGAFFWGSMADKVGRRPVFMLTLAITTIFGVAIAFSPTFWVFCLFFVFLGLGIGGNLPVDGTIFLECVPSERRFMLTLMTFWWPLGNIVDAGFGWAALPHNSCAPLDPNCNWRDNKGWRYAIFGFACITGAILFGRLLLFRMLESPKYHVARGHPEKAIETLQAMARFNNKPELDLHVTDFTKLTSKEDEERQNAAAAASSSRVASLFENLTPLFATRKEATTTILVTAIWTIGNLAGTVFYVFLPVFISQFGHLSVNQTYRNYLIQALCAIPGTFASHFGCNSFLGRKWTMALTAVGTGLFILLFTTSHAPGAQLAFNCLSSFLANLLWGAIYTYTPEVFPVAHRGTGTGFASAISRIVGAIAPFIGGRLLAVNLRFPLYLSTGLYGLMAICAVALPIETKGKTRDMV